MTGDALKARVADAARDVGFDDFGVARAEPLDEERERLRAWIAGGSHGTMTYLERLEEERLDPEHLLPGVKSVLSFAHSYAVPEPSGASPNAPRIARYARGRDYHKVLRAKLKRVAQVIVDLEPTADTRVAVDTAPLLEKAWAERAGIGWRGKHTNLVSRNLGSWFFIGTILTTADLPPDRRHRDYCGTCTRCLDACPTAAFPQPYSMDATRCISYLTIEHRGPLDAAQGDAIGDHLFGCDICLDACPWVRFTRHTEESDFLPRPEITGRELADWVSLSPEEFDILLRGSAMRRARPEGLARNAQHVARNQENSEPRPKPRV